MVTSAAARVAAAWTISAPWIAPDEFVYSLIGRTFWLTGTSTLFGSAAPFYGVYPFMVGAPLALFGPDAGLAVVQVVQAILASLTIVIVAAWARRMTRPGWAFAAAATTAALPAMAYSGLLMTETTFLVVVSLCLWMLALTLVQPELERQAVLVTLILVAIAIRVQAIVLVPAVFLAASAYAFAARNPRVLRQFLPSFAFLSVATGLGLVLRATGSGSPLGAYETAATSDYRIGPALAWIGWHLADAALLVAIVPLFGALILLIESARGREQNANVRALVATAFSYGIVSIVLVGVFASTHVEQLAERDLITVAPPIFVAFAVWLERGMPRPRVSAILSALILAPVALLPMRDLVTPAATPDALMLVPFLRLEELTSTRTLAVAWVIFALGAIVLAVIAPRRLAPVLASFIVLGLLTATVTAQRELRLRTEADRRAFFGVSSPEWIDRAAQSRVTYLYANDPLWPGVWQTAYWNDKVSTIVAISGARSYGPVPGDDAADLLEDGTLVTDGHRLPGNRDVVGPASLLIEGRRLASNRQGAFEPGRILWQATDPLRVTLRLTGIPKNRVTATPFTAEVFDCNSGVLEAAFSSRRATGVAIRVDAATPRRLDVPPGTTRVRVPLPQQASKRRMCLVHFTPEGQVVVGPVRSVRNATAPRELSPITSVRRVAPLDLRVGYCLNGTFVNLAYRQPEYDPAAKGAVFANYVDGIGLVCDPPPPGYVRRGFAPSSLGVPADVYPYYVKPTTPSD